MNNMKLKAAMHYQLDYMAKSAVYMFGIIALIMAALWIFGNLAAGGNIPFIPTINFGDSTNFHMNIGGIFVITFFIVGIAGIREDLRFFLQNGMGRYTVYFSTLLASLICSMVLGLIFEVINLLNVQFVSATAFGSSDSFLTGLVMNWVFLFFAWQLGTLISLIYYRLKNTFQVVAVSVAGGVLILSGLPNIIYTFLYAVIPNSEEATEVINEAFYGATILPQNNMPVVILLLGTVAAVLNFLLIRRAQVKE